MYYIFVYIQFVLLTPLLAKLLKKKYWYLGFVVAPISLLIKYYLLFTGITPHRYFSIIWGVCSLGWFTFYYLGLYLKNNDRKFKPLLPVYILTIAIQMIESYCWYRLGSTNCGTQLKLSALLTSSIFILLAYEYIKNSKYKGNNKLLLMIGNYSFGIYISHCMVLAFLEKLIPFWSSIPFGINTIIVLFATILCIIIGKKLCGDKISKYLGLY